MRYCATTYRTAPCISSPLSPRITLSILSHKTGLRGTNLPWPRPKNCKHQRHRHTILLVQADAHAFTVSPDQPTNNTSPTKGQRTKRNNTTYAGNKTPTTNARASPTNNQRKSNSNSTPRRSRAHHTLSSTRNIAPLIRYQLSLSPPSGKSSVSMSAAKPSPSAAARSRMARAPWRSSSMPSPSASMTPKLTMLGMYPCFAAAAKSCAARAGSASHPRPLCSATAKLCRACGSPTSAAFSRCAVEASRS
mmetsp:Transcript_35466/g.111619  ORF Transcript_35466/g.111619 Transcript_35466/m.111619 type:complete len:249 (+) Transcript_35466:3305-4051(+)